MPLLTKTFMGLSRGINRALPAWEIPDDQAVWLQDVLLDVPGVIRRRGPVQQSGTAGAFTTNDPQSLHQTVLQDGSVRVAYLSGLSTPRLRVLNSGFGATNQVTWPGDWTSAPPVWDSKPALNGGTLIGASEGYMPTTTGGLALWRGGSKAQYTTGTITSTRGSKTVTGSGTSWSANVEAGMFVIADDGAGGYSLLGTIDTVDSNTQVTLLLPALATVAASAYSIQNVRGIVPRCMKGRITVADTTNAVIGAGTKFKMMDNGETWEMFRASDMTWVGTVSQVNSDSSLLLTAQAAVSLSNEHFVCIRVQSDLYNDFTLADNKSPGFLNAVYSGRQIYANLPYAADDTIYSSRVWFSDPLDPEGLDMSPADGDFFDVTSQGGANSPIIAIASLQNAMAILKQQELYALYGSDPTQYQLRKIADVGTISAMSVVVYRNSLIFASRQGIFMFDGVALTELTSSLGDFWKLGIRNYNAETDRAYAGVYHNHFFLHVSNFASPYTPMKGASGAAPTKGTFVINLDTGAITFLTNFEFRGMITFPASADQDAWYIIPNSSDETTIGEMADLWDGTGNDVITCKGATAGPDFYLETKRYDMGDGQWKKFFKQIQMLYRLSGDTLSMDTIPGLGDDGIPASKPWKQQTLYKNARLKFMKRSTHLGFRFYETDGNVTDLRIGPWAIGFKWQNRGRI